MSILTHDKIWAEIKAKRIEITPFYPECIGPASVDLHLSRAFRIFRSPRKIVRVADDVDYRDFTYGVWLKENDSLLLMPNETILGMTEEQIKTAENIGGWLEGRSKFARIGLLVHISASFMQPGIANHQVLEMSNFGPVPLEIVPGIPVCQFIFHKTLGNASYQGRFKHQTPEDFCQ
jgi:dCTP deaminase